MELGLQIPSFTWPGGAEAIGPKLRDIAQAAEAAGYDSLWVMDHFFQIGVIGPAQEPMLEAYTALSHMAAVTSRVGLGALVTGVTYRHPGILAKTITTLDVLSGGRAWLGIGAAWNQQEHDGLGVPFPPVAERFERLEEALQIVLQMWSEDDGPYQGNHYQLAQALNSPQVLSRPHPPILIGGAGERKTLRLVAKYADACNVFGDAAMCRHKFAVLREHCEREDRDFDEIEKTAYFLMNLGEDGSGVDETVERLGALADAGAQAAIGAIVGVEDLRTIELVGEKIIPQIREL